MKKSKRNKGAKIGRSKSYFPAGRVIASHGIVGIDEVGRGSLAGPVMVAAVFLPKNIKFRALKDSKKLSPKKREEWFLKIKRDERIFWSTAKVSPKIIDKINISEAANLAATRALNKLINNYQSQIKITPVYLDGGLFVNRNPIPNTYRLKTIVKGDEKISAIKLASIMAKVKRDRLMIRMHQKYPIYNFQRHKGYGTKMHLSAIKTNGFCEIHRITFLKSFQKSQ